MARNRKIDNKSWVGALSNGDVGSAVALTATQAAIANIAAGEGLGPATLLRSRGNLLVVAVPDSANDVDTVGLGLIVVHSNALTAGGASLPGPIKDEGADWLWHQYVPVDAIDAAVAVGDNIGTVIRVEVDSKAMRRIPSDHAVVLMGELATAQMASVGVLGGVRFLLGN